MTCLRLKSRILVPKKSQFCTQVPNFTLITRCQGEVPNSKSWIASTAYQSVQWRLRAVIMKPISHYMSNWDLSPRMVPILPQGPKILQKGVWKPFFVMCIFGTIIISRFAGFCKTIKMLDTLFSRRLTSVGLPEILSSSRREFE